MFLFNNIIYMEIKKIDNGFNEEINSIFNFDLKNFYEFNKK